MPKTGTVPVPQEQRVGEVFLECRSLWAEAAANERVACTAKLYGRSYMDAQAKGAAQMRALVMHLHSCASGGRHGASHSQNKQWCAGQKLKAVDVLAAGLLPQGDLRIARGPAPCMATQPRLPITRQ